MPKLHPITNQSDEFVGYIISCPGCKQGHLFYTQPWGYNGNPGPCWEFDGNMENPTFRPSMLVNKDRPESRCHSFVRAGKIEFLSDCFHELKGQTVELPDEVDW